MRRCRIGSSNWGRRKDHQLSSSRTDPAQHEDPEPSKQSDEAPLTLPKLRNEAPKSGKASTSATLENPFSASANKDW